MDEPDIGRLLRDTLEDAFSGSGSVDRRRRYERAGARCTSCGDTGMAGPVICGCAAGSTLAMQAYRHDR